MLSNPYNQNRHFLYLHLTMLLKLNLVTRICNISHTIIFIVYMPKTSKQLYVHKKQNSLIYKLLLCRDHQTFALTHCLLMFSGLSEKKPV